MKKRVVLATLAALTLLTAMPVAAIAQTDSAPVDPAVRVGDTRITDRAPDLDRVKARLEAAIERRLERIDRLQEKVRSNPAITADHAAQLTAELSRAQGGLTALLPEVRRAATLEELRTIANEMVVDYRIFALMTPKTVLAIVSDVGVVMAERGSEIVSRISEAADRAEAAGHEVGRVRELLDEADRSIAEGLALVDPVAETVLPLQPADYPDPARAVLVDAHDDAAEGRALYRTAATTIHEAAALLREIVGGSD